VTAVIRGNHDKVAAGIATVEGFNHIAREAIAWTANVLTPENRDWLAVLAAKTLGREVPVQITTAAPAEPAGAAPKAPGPAAAASRPAPTAGSQDELRQEALSDPGVQALFEIFPVERTKIEEM
jgi:hypothetical protein